MSAPTITIEELLSELERASQPGEQKGFTTRELQDVIPHGEKKCRELVRCGLKLGRLRVSTKQIVDLAGRPARVPCYIPVETN